MLLGGGGEGCATEGMAPAATGVHSNVSLYPYGADANTSEGSGIWDGMLEGDGASGVKLGDCGPGVMTLSFDTFEVVGQ